MKKYFKKDSDIQINFGDKVGFVKTNEINGLETYNRIEGEVTPTNIRDLVNLGFVVEKEVPDEPVCKCKDSDCDTDNPLTELDNAIAGLEKVCEILKELIG